MAQQIIEARDFGRIQCQKTALNVPHQQSLTFECAANALTDEVNQLLKCCHGGRRHPAKSQPLARRHVYAVEE